MILTTHIEENHNKHEETHMDVKIILINNNASQLHNNKYEDMVMTEAGKKIRHITLEMFLPIVISVMKQIMFGPRVNGIIHWCVILVGNQDTKLDITTHVRKLAKKSVPYHEDTNVKHVLKHM